MVKVTFTLDDVTVRTLRTMAERTRKPQSLVVREAVAHYAAREDRLSAEEQARMLRAIADMRRQPPTRPQIQVAEELRELRQTRRQGWPRSSDR